jgi:hypothetical protein
MMANLFGIDIAGIMYQQMGAKLLPVTLRQPVTAARDPLNPSAGPTITHTLHRSRGFVDKKSEKYFPKTLITTADKVVAVFGKPLVTDPLPGWEVVAEGETLTVVQVERDPARAMFLLLARGQT